MFVSTADVTDRDGAISMIGYAVPYLSKCQKVLVDGGYTGINFANSVKELIEADVEVVNRNELHKFEVLPKRWIVERSLGWLKNSVINNVFFKNVTEIKSTVDGFIKWVNIVPLTVINSLCVQI